MEILKDYLPEEMGEDEIRAVALKTIEDLKANDLPILKRLCAR